MGLVETKALEEDTFSFGIKDIWARAATIRFLSEGELANSAVSVECPYVIVPNAVTPFTGAFVDKMSVCASNGIPAENHLVLFLGRICHQKGALDLLQAFELLFRSSDGRFPVDGRSRGKGRIYRSIEKLCCTVSGESKHPSAWTNFRRWKIQSLSGR